MPGWATPPQNSSLATLALWLQASAGGFWKGHAPHPHPHPRCCGNPGSGQVRSGQEKPDSQRDVTQTDTHPSVVDWMPTWRRLISLGNPQPPRGVRGETTGKRDPRSGYRNPPCHPGGFSSQLLSLGQAEPLPGPSPNSPFQELLFYAQLTVPDGALS